MRLPVVVAVVVACLLGSSSAAAFRPSTKWVIDKAYDKAIDRGTSALHVDANVVVYDPVTGASRGELAERTWLASPGPSGFSSLRRESEQGGGSVVELRVEGKLITRAPGQPDKSQKAGVDVLADLVVAALPLDAGIASDKLIVAVKGLGVNTEIVSYARFDGRVAYLIGSKPWETDKAQVWFEKDTHLPLRLVTFQKGSDGVVVKVDVRYLGWGSPVGGAWYPQTIEIWRGDKLLRRAVTQNVERNLPVDATLFR
ncbi:MAG: hypothetical protein Q8O67_16870 [Deltaproteobacteria bacterium]|nr:hypothetical protein [Deltaproteobacteria bacterium]